MDAQQDLINFMELALAQKTPVMEAEYAIDETTQLKLYDQGQRTTWS